MTVFIYIPEPCRNCKRNVTVCKQAECSINFYRKFSYMRMRSCDLYTKCDESFPEHTIYTVLTTQGSLRVCVWFCVYVVFVCVCVWIFLCKACLCIQWEQNHKWTVNFVFTKAHTAVLPRSFCWGQQWVSKHSGVWHPDAAWISGQRLSIHWEGEGGSVPHLRACLFDIAFPSPSDYIISILMQNLYNSVIHSVQPLCLYDYVSGSVCISAFAQTKSGETHEVLTQRFHLGKNHNEVSLHVFQHLCRISI